MAEKDNFPSREDCKKYCPNSTLKDIEGLEREINLYPASYAPARRIRLNKIRTDICSSCILTQLYIGKRIKL